MTEPNEEYIESGLEIAVIGMSGRFPGAGNVEEFWENLKKGLDTVTFCSEDELRELKVEPELFENSNYVKVIGNILDKELKEYFDASFFGYKPLEALVMDPQLRIFHECAWEALETAGYNPHKTNKIIGLYAGANENFSWKALTLLSTDRESYGNFAESLLTDKDYLSTRVSYCLNLNGPAIAVNSACSTSLVAIHLGCQAILNGECDIALAGGISVDFTKATGYMYYEGMISSNDGHCRAFSDKAKGTVRGEGAGIVVLKLLEEAIADKDYIYAVIKGTAINNDGNRKAGYTAPSITGQTQVIKMAHKMAGVEPETITYIETHGTGTSVGDPIEIEALISAFNTNKKRFCKIGSLKTNIGHLGSAAGVAGFIKTVLSLKNRQIPPSLHFEHPNPRIDFDNSPFLVNTRLNPWERNGNPLRAGISSFGIGGTNAHIVLEEAPEPDYLNSTPKESTPEQLLLLSAHNHTALEKMTENLRNYLMQNPDTDLENVSYTLQVGRKEFPFRRMLICSTAEQALETLNPSKSGNLKTHQLKPEEINRNVIFMFPGQGSQYAGMGIELYRTQKIFRQSMDQCFKIVKNLMGEDLRNLLYPSLEATNNTGKTKPDINQPEFAQPLLFSFEYSLAKLLIHWGIKPSAMIGYSLGEYSAACISGVMSLPEALEIIVTRSQAIQSLPESAMLSVPLTREELSPLLENTPLYPIEISLAIDNGESCIVSGTNSAVNEFEKQLKEKRLICMRIPVTHALHSKQMEPIANRLTSAIKHIPFTTYNIPYISNVTGTWVTTGQNLEPGYWATHMTNTVYYASGIEELIKEPNGMFIEVGPGRDLTALMSRYIEKNTGLKAIDLIRSADRNVSDAVFFLTKIGQLWLNGVKIDWETVNAQEQKCRVPLPTYPFQRQQYWLDEAAVKLSTQSYAGKKLSLRSKTIEDWFYMPLWKQSPLNVLCHDKKELSETLTWLIFMDELGVGQKLGQHLRAMGQQVILVYLRDEYSQINDTEFACPPGKATHYFTLFNTLHNQKQTPDKILHLWNVTGTSHQLVETELITQSLGLGYYSLVFLVQALGKLRIKHDVQIKVITEGIQDVTGDEDLCPWKAPVLGPVTVIPQEYRNIGCETIDISCPKSGDWQEPAFINRLITELTTPAVDHVVAYRGNTRWVPVYEKYSDLESKHEPKRNISLKQQGVYLITGGLGGVGRVLATYLATTVKAKLILTGRTQFPERETWDNILNTNANDLLKTKINEIREMEKLGAEVLIIQADVGSREQMQQAILKAEESFGSINGVFHSAGVPIEKMIFTISEADKTKCEELFYPKFDGLLALDAVLKNKTIDFCLIFSSLVSILGGLGFAAYTAANNFLDTFVRWRNRNNNYSWVSINWDGWLLSAIEENTATNERNRLKYYITPKEGIKTFDYILSRLKTDQIVISTGDLQTRINQWIAFQTDDEETEFQNDDLVPGLGRENLTTSYTTPTTLLQQEFVDIWQKYFGIKPIGITDDFFELGGDSLKVIVFCAKIHKKMNVEIPIEAFYKNPTIQGLCKYIAYAETSEYYSINSVEKNEYYDLPFQIVGMWLRYQYQVKDRHPFNVLGQYDLSGITVEIVENAWESLVKRHESLRTIFLMVNGEPKMKIQPYSISCVPLEFIDLRGVDAADRKKKAEKIAFDRTRIDFDLYNGPVSHAALLQLDEEKYKFVFSAHHINSDDNSKAIMEKEFMTLLAYYKRGEDNPYQPQEIQNKDYAVWQAKKFKGKKGEELRTFWMERLGGTLPGSNLPMDCPSHRRQGTYREALTLDILESFRELTPQEHEGLMGTLVSARSVKGTGYRFKIEQDVQKRVSQLALEMNCSPIAVFIAALNILFYRITGQVDSIVGVMVATREHEALENLLGYFMNTLLYRNKVNPKLTFREYVSLVGDNVIKSLQHREYPLEKILHQLNISLDSIGTVFFNYVKTEGTERHVITEFSTEHSWVDHVYFDIDFSIVEHANGIMVYCNYNKELFKPSTIDMICENYSSILAQLTLKSDTGINLLEKERIH